MNPLRLPVSVLKTILTGFNKIPWKKSSIPLLRHALVRRENGAITLSVSDLDCHLIYTHRTEPEPITPLARKLAAARHASELCAFLVPLDFLSEAARAAERDSIVELSPQRIQFQVQGTLLTTEFAAEKVSDFPPLPSIACIQQPLDERAQKAIQDAFACSSDDATRYVLQGAFIGREKSKDPAHIANHVVVGTDGRRMIRTNSMHLPALDHDLILPAWPVLRSKPIAALPWSLGFQPGIQPKENERENPALHRPPLFWLIAGPWELVGKAIEGNYPNYRQVIPAKFAHRVTLAANSACSFADTLNRLPLPGDQCAITLELAPGKELAVHVEKNRVTAAGSHCSGTLRIAFDRDFLVDALRMGFAECSFNDYREPAAFTAPGRQLVMMPMLPKDKPVTIKS